MQKYNKRSSDLLFTSINGYDIVDTDGGLAVVKDNMIHKFFAFETDSTGEVNNYHEIAVQAEEWASGN